MPRSPALVKGAPESDLGADIVSEMDSADVDVLERRQKIESLAKGLQAIFGPRAPDIARLQQGEAAIGSETAEAWRLILERILASPSDGGGRENEDNPSIDPASF